MGGPHQKLYSNFNRTYFGEADRIIFVTWH